MKLYSNNLNNLKIYHNKLVKLGYQKIFNYYKMHNNFILKSLFPKL